MRRILIAAMAVSLTALCAAPASAEHWRGRWHRDRGGSDVVDTLLKLQLFGIAVQAMQQPTVIYQQRSLKDPYVQPYVQGDPLPPQRYGPLK